MEKPLEGKTAIITGSGRRSGIGYGIARHLANLGANIVLTDICRCSQPDLDFERAAWNELVSITEELKGAGGHHIPVKADVTNPDEVKALISEAEMSAGPIGILVNNAGICITKPLLETSLADWEVTMGVNALGTFLCSIAVAKHMIAHSTPGRIVNISSISGKEGWPFFGAYTASKFAVLGLTQTLARELAPYGINVNAVCPGLITTEMHEEGLARLAELRGKSIAEVERDQLSRVPMGRYGEPDDVAKVVAFLASDESAYMTGQALNVCGGLLVCR